MLSGLTQPNPTAAKLSLSASEPLAIVKRRQVQVQSGEFPGATAPGTGTRHFPDCKAESSQSVETRERREKFEMRTTEDYYRDFPGLVRASTPLYIRQAGRQEALGAVEQKMEDAGPQTGHRKMPSYIDRDGGRRPRLPSHPEDEEDLKRERQIRYGIM